MIIESPVAEEPTSATQPYPALVPMLNLPDTEEKSPAQLRRSKRKRPDKDKNTKEVDKNTKKAKLTESKLKKGK